MVAKLDRTGEIGYNNFGSKMIIKEYINKRNMTVCFPEYNWIIYNVDYSNFKIGNIKCPYEKRTFNVGYLGEGKYKSKENGKLTGAYKSWIDMMRRCYYKDGKSRNNSYENCKISDEWHCFQNYAKWYNLNYYEVKDEKMTLDKDILVKNNKIYSPETCIFVPERINILFTKRKSLRGEYPIGVSRFKYKKTKPYMATCDIGKGKQQYLGYYDTPEEAFQVYKEFKEQIIKEVAEEYKQYIPKKLYDALYKYKVDITD